MKTLQLFGTSLFVSLLAGLASAQVPDPVTVTGRLVEFDGSSTCSVSHVLDCTASSPGAADGILINNFPTPQGAGPINLGLLEGQLFEFGLVPNPGPCGSFSVVSAMPPPATLTRCGTPAVGCPFRLRVGPSGELGQWTLWWSAAPGFVPLDDATLLLDDPKFLSSGLLFGKTATFDVTVPGDLSTVGLNLWFQGTSQSIGPIGPPRITNVECVTILSPTVVCVLPDC